MGMGQQCPFSLGVIMTIYGILQDAAQNTGVDGEISVVFSTPLTLRSNQPVFAADTISLRRRTSAQVAQRWEIDAMTAPTNDSNNFLIHSVLYGHHGVFGVRMPQTPRAGLSDLNDVCTLADDALENQSTIVLDWAVGGSESIKPGEFINIGYDTKVYLVIAAGGDELTVFPPLRLNSYTGDSVRHGDAVTMLAKFDTDTVIGMTFVDGILMDPGTVKIIEALPV